MATIKYLLQSTKENAPIYLRFSIGRNNTLKRKTGLYINPKKWSNSKSFPIPKDANLKSLKQDLEGLKLYVLHTYNRDNAKGITTDASWLEDIINRFFKRIDVSKDMNTVMGAIQYIIDNSSTRRNSKGSLGLSKSRVNSYKNLKTVLLNFPKAKKLLVQDVGRVFVDKFKDWLLNDQKYSESNTLKKISDLKGVCFEAESHGVEINKQLRSIRNTPSKPNPIIYLNRKELKQISNTVIENKSLNNAKKWLLFGCEIGQRVDDLLNLDESNIRAHEKGKFRVVSLIQGKTGKTVIIPLTPEAETIIKNGLPYKIAKSNFNKSIKDVCELAEINTMVLGSKMNPETNRKEIKKYKKWELITSHVCRRSFCSNWYGEMETAVLKSLSGHSTEKTLLKYIGKTSADYTEQAYLVMNKASK